MLVLSPQVCGLTKNSGRQAGFVFGTGNLLGLSTIVADLRSIPAYYVKPIDAESIIREFPLELSNANVFSRLPFCFTR